MGPLARTRWWWAILTAVALFVVASPSIFTSQATAAMACSGGSIQIVAHQDDDLLFMSPAIFDDIDAGRCVRTVFVTAGDAGIEDSYWQDRERGAEAAWAQMADVSNSWSTSTVSLGGKSVRMRTLKDSPNVTLVFMRLPDGYPLGTGSAKFGYQSLYRLLSGGISNVTAVDGSASYTAATLRNALLDAIRDSGFTRVRAQDYLSNYGGDQDHYDHHSVAFTTRDASDSYGNDHTLTSYLGYGDFTLNGMWPQNIWGSEMERKSDAFWAYSDYDPDINMAIYESYGWLQREYEIDFRGPSVAANGGPDQTVVAGSRVQLDARGTTATGGITFRWIQTEGTAVELSSTTSATPSFTPSRAGIYAFDVEASSGGSTSTGEVTITVTGGATSSGDNMARLAGVTATASSDSTRQPASAAIDGSLLGYPDDNTREWVTVGGKANSWIEFTFPSPIEVDQVVLYDRPNSDDRVMSGTLRFSDGSTVAVGALANTGATVVNVPPRVTTTIRFTIDSVSSSTHNVGLAEFEVYGKPASTLVANAGPDQTGYVNNTVSLDGSLSSAPAGSALSHAWSQKSGPSSVTLLNSKQAKPSLVPSVAGTYVFELTVTSGSQVARDTVSVVVTAPKTPQAIAGPDQSAATGTQVTLDGSGSTNPNSGTSLSYAWEQVSGVSVALSDATDPRPSFTAVEDGQYEFRLTVTSAGATSQDLVTVTFTTPIPQAPIANAGPDQTVAKNTLVSLDGSGSTNPNSGSGSGMTYAWRQTEGDVVGLSSLNGAKPSFTPTVAGSYTFELTVTSSGLSSTDLITVTVTDAAPTPSNLARMSGVVVTQSSQIAGRSGTNAIDGVAKGYPSSPENEWVTNGGKAGSWIQLTWDTPVTLSEVVLYDRPNSDDRITAGTLVFSDGTSVPVGQLNNNGSATKVSFAERTVTSVRLNISSVSSRTYNVGLAEFEAWGILAGTPVNRAPVAEAGPDQQAAVNSTVTLDGSGSSDPDLTDVLAYSWQQTSGPATTLSSLTDVRPTFVARSEGTYVFKLSVSDGSLSASDTVTVNVSAGQQTNIARLPGVVVTESSRLSVSPGIKAVDGVISGYPTDETKEWSTNRGKAGSWIKLAWSSPVTIDRVVLYDRINSDDQILSGTLLFSDGTTVPVGQLNNSGGATTITFTSRTTTSVQFTVNSVSRSTHETGLAEFEVFGS